MNGRRFKIDRSPPVIIGFLALLIVPQLVAFGLQFKNGFRPFINAPVRVPLSWDMFATRIERCLLRWTPPIEARGRTIATLQDVMLRFEWDLIFDEAWEYQQTGLSFCPKDVPGAKINLRCFLPNGTEASGEYACGK